MAYSFNEAADLIIKAGKELVARGLIARTWGNISARLSDTEFLITPSGQAYDSLTPEKLVVVKIADCSYEGKVRPSSEKGVHGEAYKYRPDVDFVIHTHQTMATAVSTLGEDVTAIPKEMRDIIGNRIVCAAYGISSTKTLMRRMSKAIQENRDVNAFYMKYHGTLCLGSDDAHAFAVSEAMEKISTACIEQAIGGEVFTPKNLARVFEKKKGVPGSDDEKPVSVSDLERQLEERLEGQTILVADTPILKSRSLTAEPMRPMIDDMAQIVGTKISNVPQTSSVDAIVKALGKQNAVLLQGVGAICVAHTKEDAQAVRQVLEKDVVCEMYASLKNAVKPLGWWDARFQRHVYLDKYSKQMSY